MFRRWLGSSILRNPITRKVHLAALSGMLRFRRASARARRWCRARPDSRGGQAMLEVSNWGSSAGADGGSGMIVGASPPLPRCRCGVPASGSPPDSSPASGAADLPAARSASRHPGQVPPGLGGVRRAGVSVTGRPDALARRMPAHPVVRGGVPAPGRGGEPASTRGAASAAGLRPSAAGGRRLPRPAAPGQCR